jgi:hypothetical protein
MREIPISTSEPRRTDSFPLNYTAGTVGHHYRLRPAYARKIRLTRVHETSDYVIVIYTWGTEERDRLKAKLHSLGFTNVPYRGGCKMFEAEFGSWKQWFKEESNQAA